MNVKNLFRRLLPLMLTLAILLPLAGPITVTDGYAKKITQAELDALKQDASSLHQQKKELQKQLKEIKADKNAAQHKKNVIEQQIGVIQDEISNMDHQINTYDQMIAQKSEEIAEGQAKEAEQYRLFCQRVRCMEESGPLSYWSILFSSASFSDLLDNFMMVEEIMAYDNAVMDNLVATRERIEAEKADLEKLRSEQEEARKKQLAAKNELSTREGEVDELIKEISTKQDALEAREAELRKAADAVDAELRRKEKEFAAQISNVPSESGFLWPLPGYDTLSSLYGKRKHPVTGRPNNHTGIDIPAPAGTKILAAKSGVVTTSKYNRSYGNYVVVSHSDGTSTLYAHMSKRLVKEGQTVKQGQSLGLVGTTGSSTGNHLHYEIRVRGNRTDPVNYYKDKTLYARANGKRVLLEH